MINSDAAVSEAKTLIEKYGRITPDELASNLGINVWPRNFARQKGVYTLILGEKYVFIKEDLSDEMHNIVLMHEIGHDRLHSDVLTEKGLLTEKADLFDNSSDIMEHEANIFAAEMLLPDEDVLELVYQGFTAPQVASALNADINLVALKIAELNRRGFKFNEQNYRNKFLKAN